MYTHIKTLAKTKLRSYSRKMASIYKKALATIAALVIGITSCLGEPIFKPTEKEIPSVTLTTGETLRNVRIQQMTSSQAWLVHSNGTKIACWNEISKKDQLLMGFDSKRMAKREEDLRRELLRLRNSVGRQKNQMVLGRALERAIGIYYESMYPCDFHYELEKEFEGWFSVFMVSAAKDLFDSPNREVELENPKRTQCVWNNRCFDPIKGRGDLELVIYYEDAKATLGRLNDAKGYDIDGNKLPKETPQERARTLEQARSQENKDMRKHVADYLEHFYDQIMTVDRNNPVPSYELVNSLHGFKYNELDETLSFRHSIARVKNGVGSYKLNHYVIDLKSVSPMVTISPTRGDATEQELVDEKTVYVTFHANIARRTVEDTYLKSGTSAGKTIVQVLADLQSESAEFDDLEHRGMRNDLSYSEMDLSLVARPEAAARFKTSFEELLRLHGVPVPKQ